MTSLILATSLSDLYLEEIIKINNKENPVIVATDPAVNAHLKDAGISSQFISSDIAQNDRDRDKNFANLTMPGVFTDNAFYKSNLELWKVLSIDRLNFWYGGDNVKNTIDMICSLDWDTLHTDFNINSPYPFALALQSDYSIAYKTHSIRMPEVYDMARFLPFDEIVVEKGEGKLLKSVQGKIIEKESDTWRAIEGQSSRELKGGLGIDGKYVIGVVYDKLWEWSVRKFLEEALEKYPIMPHFVFFPVDKRSEELLPKCLSPYRNLINFCHPEAMRACDKVYAFGWNDYLSQYNWNLEIVDWYGKNRAQILAPEGVKVHESLPVD